MTNYLLAGGGTAGHVNPLLSLADAIRSSEPNAQILALGTKEGLESTLVPARGYELATIQRLPFPRKLNGYALGFPAKFLRAVRECKRLILDRKIDVVVGFGGYASAPAYLAAKSLGIPHVVHEANALPGWANKLGARSAAATAKTFKNTPLDGEVTGMPLRSEIEAIAKRKNATEARIYFGLEPETFTLLVTGGSLGAKKINDTVEASRRVLSAAGIQVLHIVGGKSELKEVRDSDYVRIGYCDRMDLAIAASDLAVSRAGASTVSEFMAVGLPAIYIPYPVGNGEQKHNLQEVLEVEGGVMVLDKDFTPEYVAQVLVPLISNSKEIAAMGKRAKSVGIADGTARLLSLVHRVLN